MSTQTFDSYSQGAALTDTGVLGVVSGAISRGALPVDANGIYFVLGSGDVTESGSSGTFCSDFCGWHTRATLFGSDIKYAFVGNGFPQCINNPSALKTCAFEGNQSVSPNGNPGADAMVNTISHELSETVTDPDVNAWYNPTSDPKRILEVGDICFQQFEPTFAAPNGSRANLTLGGVNYLSQTLFLNDGGGRCTMSSTGNVFLYSSAHDQYYGCHGIASGSTADCNNISDANDRLICQAVAQHSQTPCSTPVTDRNLQLSCFGIAFAPNFPTNCRDITNPQMQAFCYGVSSGGPMAHRIAALWPMLTRVLCAMAWRCTIHPSAPQSATPTTANSVWEWLRPPLHNAQR